MLHQGPEFCGPHRLAQQLAVGGSNQFRQCFRVVGGDDDGGQIGPHGAQAAHRLETALTAVQMIVRQHDIGAEGTLVDDFVDVLETNGIAGLATPTFEQYAHGVENREVVVYDHDLGCCHAV